ncbi:hypothetical protein BH11BAC3_BH11BAC3_09600 [soil metagenome]
MRLFKAFLFGITGLFVIITLFSLLIPSRVMVSRAVVINDITPDKIYLQVANFEKWQKWHPIFTIDSAKINCKGAELANSSETCIIVNRGKEINLSLISADTSSIKFLFKASSENDVENDIVIVPTETKNAIQVEWRAVTKLHWYPWEKFYGIFIDQLTGNSYDLALHGLKDYLEKN